jgi:hypothetical protein
MIDEVRKTIDFYDKIAKIGSKKYKFDGKFHQIKTFFHVKLGRSTKPYTLYHF